MRQLQATNLALEAEKSVHAEWHAMDASDLSRQMQRLTDELEAERRRSEMFQQDFERSEAMRLDAVDRLHTEIHEMRQAHAQDTKYQIDEVSRLDALLDQQRQERVATEAEVMTEHAALRSEVGRQEALVEHSRELAAGNAVVMRTQISALSNDNNKMKDENERLRRELEEARGNFARLGAHSREREVYLTSELARLNAVVERLGGEKAESRSEMLGRLEAVSGERERTVADLTSRLERSEAEREKMTTQLHDTLGKMRWLQSKALDSGTAKSGKHRNMMYYESLKNPKKTAPHFSWRTENDGDKLSEQTRLQHQLETDQFTGDPGLSGGRADVTPGGILGGSGGSILDAVANAADLSKGMGSPLGAKQATIVGSKHLSARDR